jgi:hypothetical protein
MGLQQWIFSWTFMSNKVKNNKTQIRSSKRPKWDIEQIIVSFRFNCLMKKKVPFWNSPINTYLSYEINEFYITCGHGRELLVKLKLLKELICCSKNTVIGVPVNQVNMVYSHFFDFWQLITIQLLFQTLFSEIITNFTDIFVIKKKTIINSLMNKNMISWIEHQFAYIWFHPFIIYMWAFWITNCVQWVL